MIIFAPIFLACVLVALAISGQVSPICGVGGLLIIIGVIWILHEGE